MIDFNNITPKENQEEQIEQLRKAIRRGNKSESKPEKALEIIALVVLICGLTGAVLCLFLCFPDNSFDRFEPKGLVTMLIVALSTLAVWGLLSVVANISKTLKEINKKIK